MNSNNRIAATLYSLGTYVVVCLRNICVNTLHKGYDNNYYYYYYYYYYPNCWLSIIK